MNQNLQSSTTELSNLSHAERKERIKLFFGVLSLNLRRIEINDDPPKNSIVIDGDIIDSYNELPYILSKKGFPSFTYEK